MDMMMISKDNTTASDASAQHHQQEAMCATVDEAKNVKQARQQAAASGSGERKPRPQLDEVLKCPRCDSSNTKFCYYNNRSVSQPRYYCKYCRRYWTQGGSLRNIPVGGGSRKNKRSSASALSSSSSVPSSSIAEQDFSNVLPTLMSTGFDLPENSLPFPPLSLSSLAPTPSFLDMLRGGFLDYEVNRLYNAPASSSMETPLFGLQNVVVGDHDSGEDAAATATHQAGGNKQQEGESVPDTANAKIIIHDKEEEASSTEARSPPL